MNDDLGNFPQLLKADAKQRIRKKIRIDLPNGMIDTATPDEAVQVPSYPDALNQLRSVEWSGMPSRGGRDAINAASHRHWRSSSRSARTMICGHVDGFRFPDEFIKRD